MNLPRTLLVTGTLPGTAGVGALYLDELLQAFHAGQFACYCPTAQPFTESANVPTRCGSWDREKAFRLNWGGADALLAHGVYRWNCFRHTPAVVEEAVRFAREQGAEQIWAVLDTPLLYRLAVELADRLKRPLVASIWDPPEGIMQSLGHDRFSRQHACRDYQTALRRCERIGVISEAMRDDYASWISQQRMTILRHAPAAPAGQPVPRCWPDDEITIAFVGSLYGLREFEALVVALDSTQWKIAGRQVRLIVYGRSLQVRSSGRACIEYRGWRSQEEVQSAIREATLGYVPYWFDSRFARSVELCFPTKFTSYLCADLPTLYHGPERSMPTRFLKQYRAGVGCHSLEPKAIVQSLHRLLETPREDYVLEARRARRDELNLENFVARFEWLLTGRDTESPAGVEQLVAGGVGLAASTTGFRSS